MAEPFLGEIRLFSFNFPPRGWAQCSGQLLAISQNSALFSLLGTFYGGNGTTNFALPNLQGRVPIHMNGTYPLGSAGGEENHTLTQNEIPPHVHAVNVVDRPGTATAPDGRYFAAHRGGYSATGGATLAPGAIGLAGGSQAHPNMAPFLVVNFSIALQGIFPSRS